MICFVPHCAHYTERHTCKFFRFPKDGKERVKWTKAIRRKDEEPRDTSRVCSCHFKDHKKENGPSIFPWNEKKIFAFPSPKKQRHRRIIAEAVAVDDVCPNSLTDEEIVGLNEERNKSTQTISSVQDEAEITLLKSEIARLKIEVESLKKQPFGFACIANEEFLIKYYTGISKEAFLIICDLCSHIEFSYFYGWKPASISLNDQILMTLMKLRVNLGYVDLGVRFNTSKHTVGNIVMTFIDLLHEVLFKCGMKDIPSQEAKNMLSLPNCFSNFKNCRIVLDCTEFRCEIPKNLNEQKDTYSNYKHSNTLKGLIGVSPNGTITYASKLYPGSTSDKAIVKDYGIVNSFHAGDLILADKGFLLNDIVPKDVFVNIPPFLTLPQFTPTEVEETRNIAKARIHVERAIRRLKIYHVLRFIPKILYKQSSKIFQLCAALTNYQNPLIREVTESYKLLHSTMKDSSLEIDVDSDSELYLD